MNQAINNLTKYSLYNLKMPIQTIINKNRGKQMSKNTLAAIAALFILGSTISAEAKSCIGCSAQIPDNANFCSKCMTPQPKAATIGQQRMQKEPREVILDMFAFIDNYEVYFHELEYLNILGKMPEIKTQFQNASVRYKNIEKMLPEECRLLANIYAAKFQLFDGITNVMKNLRLDSGYRNALLKSALLTMAYYNKIIDEFRSPRNWNQQNIELLKKQMENVNDRVQKYQVTSKYLKFDDENKVPNGESIMVLGISGNKAHVMYMGPSMTNDAVQGTFPLSTLEKRTTWKKANVFFFEEIRLHP